MKRLFIFLLFAGVCAAAANAAAPTPQPAMPPGAMDSILGAIVDTVNNAFSSVMTNSSLMDAGKQLSYMLFGLMMVWYLIKSMVEGGGLTDIAAAFIPLAGLLGIIYILVDQGGIEKIIGFFDWISEQFSGVPKNLAEMIDTSLRQSFLSAWNIASGSSMNSAINWDWDTVVPIVASTIVRLALQSVAALLVVIAGAIYVANVILAHGSIMLAVALAPIMIPFILVPSLSFIFDGWLRFLLIASMMKVVGSFTYSLTSALMGQLVVLAGKLKFPPSTDPVSLLSTNLLYYSALVLLALLCAWLMGQTPTLANALISGTGGNGMNVRLGALSARTPNLAPLTAKLGELASSIANIFKK